MIVERLVAAFVSQTYETDCNWQPLVGTDDVGACGDGVDAPPPADHADEVASRA